MRLYSNLQDRCWHAVASWQRNLFATAVPLWRSTAKLSSLPSRGAALTCINS